jgi:AraC-like DNA-binding protein
MHTFWQDPLRGDAARAAAWARHKEQGSADTALIRQRFSVAGEPRERQLLAWRDRLAGMLEVPLAPAQIAGGFHAELDTYLLPDIVYLDSRTDATTLQRSAQKIAADDMRDYCFHVLMQGIAETETGTAQRRLTTQFVPGILALDMGQPMSMRRPTRARALAFFLPRAVVEAAIPQAESLHGKVVGYAASSTRQLRAHLQNMCDALPTMGDAEVDHALHVAARLILTTFRKAASQSHSARGAARAAMLGRIKHYIDAHLHSQELVPEKILGCFPLARATLYRMFEQEGGLHAYIRNCRLRKAADELAGSRSGAIGELGGRLGFSYAADFTRAFRRAYGMAPQEFRALQRQWLDQPYDSRPA